MWFKGLMTGCHYCWMGDVWIPDQALTLEVVQAMLETVDEEYHSLVEPGQRKLEVCRTASMMIVIGYTAALQGKGIPQVDIGMLRRYWAEGKEYERKPHVPLTLVGQFFQLAKKISLRHTHPALSSYHFIKDKGAKLGWVVLYKNMMKWASRLGPCSELMPRAKQIGNSPTVSHLDSFFHDILKRVQYRRLDLIGNNVKVDKEEYSARRSFRRGAMTEAQH
ncbi:hypothetical protein ACA910_004498 [Epithemia clementina (nom. ined.)]